MNNLAEVYLWGTCIGYLQLKDNASYAQFEYDKDFVNRIKGSGIQLSPVKMPISDQIYAFPGLEESFHGVPGLIADSLPDKFGNAVINQWLASQGKAESDFNVIDRLCYTGSRGMGALEYRPAFSSGATNNEIVNVSEMVKLASDILSKRASVEFDMSNATYSQLLQLGTSAGGARAKAIIAWNEKTNEVCSGQTDPKPGYGYWLMKFDGVAKNGDHELEDSIEYTLIEYAYYLMAIKAGIVMSECRLFAEGSRQHFMTRRFDRVDGEKIHMQTLSAIAHIDYNTPRLCSYEQAVTYMRQLGLGQNEIEQFYRRMVFNAIAVNMDDHVKNISFLMDRRGKWSLSPAYDVTFAYNPENRWLRAHQMTINGKSDHFSVEDFLLCGQVMGLTKRKCTNIIAEVTTAVATFPDIAHSAGIKTQTIDTIEKIQKNNRVI